MIDTDKQPWAHLPAIGPILRPADAAAYLGISVQGYYEKAAAGSLPVPLKITGGRASGVPRPWLDAVIAAAAAANSPR